MNNVAILVFALIMFGYFGKWGIVILILASIGLTSILIWTVKKLAVVYRRNFPRQDASDRQQVSFVGNNIPQNIPVPVAETAGSRKGFFIPKYKDVIVPDKHDFATVVEFENQHTQWIYDVMAGVKVLKKDCYTKLSDRIVIWLCLIFAGFVALAGNAFFLACIVAFVVFTIFVGGPVGSRAERSMAKRCKSLTTQDWVQVYQDVAESNRRSEEIASAIRRSGAICPPSRW